MSFVRAIARPNIQDTSSPPRPTLNSTLEPETTSEPRRSHRDRQPSARRVESDEYEASQRDSGSPPKSKPKSKKRKSSKPGERPGIIIQPAADIGPTSDQGPQSSASEAGSDFNDSHMAGSDAGDVAPKATRRAEAVRDASQILGVDASRYSSSTLKQIIASGKAIREEGSPGPMEVEAGGSSSLQQSTERIGLASGREPPPGGIANGAATAQGSAQPHTGPERSYLDAPQINTDTEPSSDSDHLRPEDSVSQRIPPPPRAPSQRASTISQQAPKRLFKPPPFKRTGFSSGSNLEPEEETVRSLKRQRTTPASLVLPLPARPALPACSLLPARPSLPARPLPSQSQSQRSLARPASLPVRPNIIPPPTPSQGSTLPLLEPPSTSDASAVLAWAARLAKQASTSRHVTEAGHSATYQQLASILEDLSQSRHDPSTTHQSSRAQHIRTPEDNAAVLEAEAVLVLGKQASHKRPTLQDYPGLVGHIAALAIPELIATAATTGAYGTHDILASLTSKVFTGKWTRDLPDLHVQKPPVSLVSLLVHCISWARCQTKVRIRPHIPADYKFINPPRDAEDVKYNRRRAKALLPNAFHCRGLKTDIHPYEHPALSHCIAAAFFWAADSIGMSFHKLFYPIPIPTVAMTLTSMQHGISEWTTGRYVSKSLDLEKQCKIYEAHLAGLANFGKDDPDRLREMQIDWFWYAVDYAGGSLEDEEPVQPVTWADRVSADESDPEADSEDDDLYDE